MAFKDSDFPGAGKTVGILGVPLGFCAGQTGSELGITAMRLAKMRGKSLVEHIADLGYKVKDYGDAEIIKPDCAAAAEDKAKYLKELQISSENSARAVKEVLADGAFPVILGGDHSTAIGTFSGVSSFYREANNEEIGLIWFDAHADINTPETSESGNLHGMPLAVLLGLGDSGLVNLENFAPKLNPKYCAHVGARDLDLGEKRRIRELGLRENFFTMSDIDRRALLKRFRARR
jgi:arginase